MNTPPPGFAIALALAIAFTLPGCNSSANLTEQEHIQRAKDFEDEGNLKGSVVELKNAVQKNPDSAQGRFLLGQVYLKLGMGAEAEKELSQSMRLGVGQESVTPLLADALLLMSEYKRLLDEIQPDNQAPPARQAKILQLRADALYALGRFTEACEQYPVALALDKTRPATYWGLAQCATIKRDPAGAQNWLNQARALPDRQAITWIRIGDLDQFRGNSDQAIVAYTQALKIEPKNVEALHDRALHYASQGKIDAAQADADTLRKVAPQSVATLYVDATLQFQAKKYAGARETLQRLFKIAPDYRPALQLGGSVEAALGNLQTAEVNFAKVARAEPWNLNARQLLAQSILRQGRAEDAERALEGLNFDKINNPALLGVAGDIATARRQFARAVTFYERATDLAPNNPKLRADLGIARMMLGESRGITDLEAAAALDRSGDRIDSLLILAQLRQKKFEDALASIATLEKKNPKNPLAWHYRGIAQLGLKQLAAARQSFERSLALDIGFFPAASSLATLDLEQGKPDEARKRFESILARKKDDIPSMMALAELADRASQPNEQADWLAKAVKANPKNLDPAARLVRFHLSRKQPKEALALAKSVFKANPAAEQAFALLGSTQLSTGDSRAAVDTFNQLVAKLPKSANAQVRLALAQIADKQPASARDALKKALLLEPGHLGALNAQLDLDMSEKHVNDALGIARQMQARHPRRALGFEREGDIALSRRDLAATIRAYVAALDRGAGGDIAVKLHRAQVLSGQSAPADERLAGWLASHPDDAIARTYLAERLMRANRTRDAIALYETVIRLSPGNVIARNNLAALYQQTGDPRALAAAEQAFVRAPTHPGVLDTLGWILVERGQLARATPLLAQAAAAAPGIASIRYHHGVALARSGKNAAARLEIQAALAADSAFAEAHAARQLLNTL
jgi:putative PEP-CTERM system TPR-repeat lipoprotein